MVEKLGKQGFHCDLKEPFEPITKAFTETSQALFEGNLSTTKAIEGLDESNVHVKTLELISINGVFESNLIRPIAKLLVPTEKSQFRVYNHPNSENWNDYIKNGENLEYMVRVIFWKIWQVFQLGDDVFKTITDDKFITTDSPDAKLIAV